MPPSMVAHRGGLSRPSRRPTAHRVANSRCAFFESSGLRALFKAHEVAVQHDRDLRLACRSQMANRVLEEAPAKPAYCAQRDICR
jgi:hypothetical protein